MNTAQLITSLLEEHQPANIVIIGSAGSGKTITANSISTNNGRHNPIIIEAQAERQLPPHCLSGAAAIIILRITNVETARMLSEYTGGRVSPTEIMSLSHLVGYFVVPNCDPVKLDIRQLLPTQGSALPCTYGGMGAFTRQPPFPFLPGLTTQNPKP